MNVTFISDFLKLSRGYYFCGLSVESEWLVSAIRDDGIYFIKCSDGNILKVLPSYIEHLSYVNIKRGNTLVSDEKNHSVHCLNRDKETVWTFSSHAMKGPKDICTDAFGNIFVAACDSQSLIVISSDGKICKKLLWVEDGIVIAGWFATGVRFKVKPFIFLKYFEYIFRLNFNILIYIQIEFHNLIFSNILDWILHLLFYNFLIYEHLDLSNMFKLKFTTFLYTCIHSDWIAINTLSYTFKFTTMCSTLTCIV